MRSVLWRLATPILSSLKRQGCLPRVPLIARAEFAAVTARSQALGDPPNIQECRTSPVGRQARGCRRLFEVCAVQVDGMIDRRIKTEGDPQDHRRYHCDRCYRAGKISYGCDDRNDPERRHQQIAPWRRSAERWLSDGSNRRNSKFLFPGVKFPKLRSWRGCRRVCNLGFGTQSTSGLLHEVTLLALGEQDSAQPTFVTIGQSAKMVEALIDPHRK